MLRETWGYEQFRPLQSEAMQSVVQGRDSVVVMPTGGGKSLCYQVPALLLPGTAVVISPLISLMKDQVDALVGNGVAAAFLNSTQTVAERRTVRTDFEKGRLKLLYLAPERVRSDDGYRLLANGQVSFFAIDEAHCVSLWGHDFRPDYRELRSIREHFPSAAVHAYTATAAAVVRDDIAQQLELREPQVLVGSFDRPNLSYRVERRGSAGGLDQILEVVRRNRGESGVIYCMSRKDVERLSSELNDRGISARPYHAGLADDVRKANQDAFIREQIQTIVATVAFGMGIDKSNVRYVIHAALPSSLENYQQESGRAGRDGLPADCLLLYSGSDVLGWQRRIEDQPEELRPRSRERLNRLLDYCQTVRCRHRELVAYFGQDLENDCQTACDHCSGGIEFLDDALLLAQKILSSIHRQGQRFGAKYTALVLKGSGDPRIRQNGHDALSTFGLLSDHPEKTIGHWIGQLASQGYIERSGEYQELRITDEGRRLLKGEAQPRLTAIPTRAREDEDASETLPASLFEELRKLRRALAEERGVPPYMIFSDATLKELARLRPANVASLRSISGIGAHKQAAYGEAFAECIASWISNEGASSGTAGTGSRPADSPRAISRTAVSRPAKRGRSATSREAAALFESGRTVDEVAAQLKRAKSTAFQYLTDYLKDRKVVSALPWVADEDCQRVESAIEQMGRVPLKALFEHFGGKVSYDVLRIVAQCRANRSGDESAEAQEERELSDASSRTTP